MDDKYSLLLREFTKMAQTGIVGSDIDQSKMQYLKEPTIGRQLVAMIRDFVNQLSGEDRDLASTDANLCSLLIAAYRQAKTADTDEAWQFVRSFRFDYPGAPGSCMLPRVASLATAALAAKRASHTQSQLLVWQVQQQLFQAYNGFLDLLFGYLIILHRLHLRKPVYPKEVLTYKYGVKVQHLSALSKGDDGIFYFLLRLARPKIRNAIAHNEIWLDASSKMIRYNVNKTDSKEGEISLDEFCVLGMLGSRLVQPYIIALSVIQVMEFGTPSERQELPKRFREIFNYERKSEGSSSHRIGYDVR